MGVNKFFSNCKSLKTLAVGGNLCLLRLCEAVLGRRRTRPRVTLAATGTAALRHIEREFSDHLLWNLRLPDIDGFELLRQLRADEGLRATTIVTVSGTSASAVDRRGSLPPGVILTPKAIQFTQLKALATILEETKGSDAQPDCIADYFPVLA